MCRIWGYFDVGDRRPGLDALGRASAAQIAGGPDEQAAIACRSWGLGVNRLAIQSPSSGRQPYVRDGITVAFNGEIYNHEELRDLLRARGRQVVDPCDGAVIAPLYEEFGADFVTRLEGMFAIALVDERDRARLVLASDPLGIKSLYLRPLGCGLAFASELAGLDALAGPAELDPGSFAAYLGLQCLPPGRTPYRETTRLLPGELFVRERGSAPHRRIVRTPDAPDPPSASAGREAEALRDLLAREVQLFSRSDHPFAIKLSGGLDSSLLSTLFARSKPGTIAYHVTYDWPWAQDERRHAADAARHAGLPLRTVTVPAAQLPELVIGMVGDLGMPNAAPHAVSSHALFACMEQDGLRVCVSGEGADEQFAGYRRHRRAVNDQVDGWWRRYRARLAAAPEEACRSLVSPDCRASLQALDPDDEPVPALSEAEDADSRLRRVLDYDLHVKLPAFNLSRLDHLSMARSIEVRVPFCQPAVTRFARTLPRARLLPEGGEEGKAILFDAARGLVPEAVRMRRKQPFTLPVQSLIEQPSALRDLVQDTLAASRLVGAGILDRTAVRALAACAGGDHFGLLWALVVYELWLGRGPPAPTQVAAIARTLPVTLS